VSLPVISGHQCIKALAKIGFYELRQKGSHVILRCDEPRTTVVVPDHKQLKKGLLRKIIRDAGLTVDEFNELL